MKKLLFLLALVPFLFACQENEPVTKISGTALNVEEGYFILGGRAGAKDTIAVTEDNSFEFIADIDEVVYCEH